MYGDDFRLLAYVRGIIQRLGCRRLHESMGSVEYNAPVAIVWRAQARCSSIQGQLKRSSLPWMTKLSHNIFWIVVELR
ncbi:hypothetical protein [Candidatus Anaplasma sp. TIGMIC]|uniref:hypothetical protein n=1 Tax=Candidatus Anaplasma sp. TIGMIC TaxID=3020713 RepID=UPI00232E05FA|nr:hypothetical protein [Candidatus Anaplasma sp. TIGMIC]